MVRRIKDDIREIQGGFPKRHVVQLDIDGLPEDAPELAALGHCWTSTAASANNDSAAKPNASRRPPGLLITGLQQRLLSSIEAFARTLRVHRKTVQRQWELAQSEQAAKKDAAFRPELDLFTESVGSDDDRAALVRRANFKPRKNSRSPPSAPRPRDR